MRRSLLALALLSTVAVAAAQAPVFSTVEERMSAAEFKAAGLDKLTPEELARLNAWLAQEVEKTASSLPAATPRADDRGFNRDLLGDGGPAIRSSIAGEFRGWQGRGDRITLTNGQVWEIFDSSSRLSVKLQDPSVVIEPGLLGSWYLKVDGYNTRAKVKRIK